MPKITAHGGPSNQFEEVPDGPESTPEPQPQSAPEAADTAPDDRPAVRVHPEAAEGSGEAPNLGAEE